MVNIGLKLKNYLWVGLLIFLISNIAVTFVFQDNLAQSFINFGDSNFELDATILLTHINIIFMPWEPVLPKMVSSIRDFSLIICVILSIIILYKEKSWKNAMYAILLSFMGVVILFIQLEIVSPGIYDFFRKVKASYTLGVITVPWLYYYLIILIPAIVMLIILSLELLKIKRISRVNQ